MNSAPIFRLGDGIVTTSVGSGTSNDFAYGVVVQPDGKIVVVGSRPADAPNPTRNDFTIIRYNADGSLDTSFGTGGVRVEPMNPNANQDDFARSVMLDANGNIVVVGASSNNSNYDFAVLRLTPAGVPDTSFSGDGKLLVNFDVGSDDRGYGSAIDGTGDILIAGWTRTAATGYQIGVTRINSDGTVDTTFAGDGTAVAAVGNPSNQGLLPIGVAAQSDGKVVVAAYTDQVVEGITRKALTVVRFNADGSLDTTFGTTGIVVPDFNGNDATWGHAVRVLADGKILIAGTTTENGNNNDMALFRLNADGTPDTTFGADGLVNTRINNTFSGDFGRAFVVDASGNIYVAGTSSGSSINSINADFVVQRYTSAGVIDTTFGTNGTTVIQVGASTDIAWGIALAADGGVILAGETNTGGSSSDFAVVKLTANGILDTSFDARTPTFTEGGAAVVLASNASIVDTETDFTGSVLSIARQGGADAHDSFTGSGNLSFSGGNAVLSSATIGTVTNVDGALSITFGAGVSQAQINEVARSIAYSNTSLSPPSSVTLAWSFTDTATATGAANTVSTTSRVTIIDNPATTDTPAAPTGVVVVSGQSLMADWFQDGASGGSLIDNVVTTLTMTQLQGLTGHELKARILAGTTTLTDLGNGRVEVDGLTAADRFAIELMERSGTTYSDIVVVEAAFGGRPVLKASDADSFFDETKGANPLTAVGDGTGDWDGLRMASVKSAIDAATAGLTNAQLIGVTWAQGEADDPYLETNAEGSAADTAAEALYKAGVRYTLNEIIEYTLGKTAFGSQSTANAYIQHIGGRNGFDNGINDVKTIQEQLAAENANFVLATESYDVARFDSVHPTPSSYHLLAERMAAFIADGESGPRVTNVALTSNAAANTATVTLTLSFPAGFTASNLVLGDDNGARFLSVFDQANRDADGVEFEETPIPVTGVQVSGNTIVFTLGRALVGNGTVLYGYTNANATTTNTAVNPISLNNAGDGLNEALDQPLFGFRHDFQGSAHTIDTTAPTLASSVPADNAANAQPANNVVLTFSEAVQAGAGQVRLMDAETNTEVAATVTFAGTQVTIDPTTDLAAGKSYYVTVDANAIVDHYGNAFAGIADATTLNFTTATPPPPLAAGAIAFLAYSAYDAAAVGVTPTPTLTDGWAFLALQDIPLGQQITFTDNGFSNGALQTGEQTFTWTSSGIAAGTVVTVQRSGGSAVPSTGTVVSGGFAPQLSTTGDQIIAYTGTAASPTFLAAINMNVAPGQSGGFGTETDTTKGTALPSGLTEGVNAIGISPERAAAYYSGPTSFNSPEAARAAINNPANWTSSTTFIETSNWKTGPFALTPPPGPVNDTATVTEEVAPSTTGNVLTNDVASQAGATLRVVEAGGFNIAAGSSAEVFGDYGVLTIHSDGSYTYTIDEFNFDVDALNTGQSLTETFQYSMAENGGTPQTATLTVTIQGRDEPAPNTAPVFTVGDGVVTTAITTGTDQAYGVLVQPDGKIVVAGSTPTPGTSNPVRNDFTLTRYNADGSIDTSFGTAGVLIRPANPSTAQDDFARTIMRDAAGNLIVTGWASNNSDFDFAVMRLTPNGAFDTTFGGGDGIALVPTFETWTDTTVVPSRVRGSDDRGHASAIDADGNIIVAGWTRTTGNYQIGVAKVKPDGTMETAFGGDGTVVTAVGNPSNQGLLPIGVAAQSDGKIVVAAYTDQLIGSVTKKALTVLRYNTDGQLDTTFGGGDGIAVPTFTGENPTFGHAIRVLSDGKILIAGYTTEPGNNDIALFRLNSDGSADTTFGGDGLVNTRVVGSSGDFGQSMVVDAAGNIFIAGYTSANGNNDFVVQKYLASGAIDTSFGTNGSAIVAVSTGSDVAWGIALAADGDIVVTGQTTNAATGVDYVVVRLTPAGQVDRAFDDAPVFTEQGSAVVIDANISVSDAGLDALGSYSGALLSVEREGGSNADVFSATGNLSFSGNSVVLSGVTIGTITANENGLFRIYFNGNATQARVVETMRSLAYANTSDNSPATIEITWTLQDGNFSDAQGSGGPLETSATSVISVVQINDAPTASPVDLGSAAGTARVITSAELLAGVVDPDGPVLTITSLTTVAPGTLANNGNGTWTYTPAANETGTVTFSYSVSDGTNIATSTASLLLEDVNEAPVFAYGDGVTTTDVSNDTDVAKSVTVLPNGKILVAGYSWGGSGAYDFSLARYNADGSLDTSFGTNGSVVTGVRSDLDYGNFVTTQPDGKILVVGGALNSSRFEFGVVRYNANGSLDTTFSSDGKVSTRVGEAGQATGAVVQADGKIVVYGYAANNVTFDQDFGLVRYNANGTLDTTFGTNGIVLTNFSSGTSTIFGGADSNDYPHVVTIGANGTLLVAGLIENNLGEQYFAVARYTSAGVPDAAFGTGGEVKTPLIIGSDPETAVTLIGKAVAKTADGGFVVAGALDSWDVNAFGVARFDANGQLVTTFGTDGFVTTEIDASVKDLNAVVVAPDGSIIAAGMVMQEIENGVDEFGDPIFDFITQMVVVRYTASGVLDTSFGGGDGIVTIPIGSDATAYGLALQPDGKILLTGYANLGSGLDFALARLNADGSLDSGFDVGPAFDTAPTYVENGAAILLDGTVGVFDAELSVTGNYAGATLTMARQVGADPSDVFGSALIQGGNVVVSGVTIGTVTTSTGGTLVLTFNANATQALVNTALSSITYANTSDAPPASVAVSWTFSDGNTGAQGAGGAKTATGTTTVTITPVNDAPVPGAQNLATKAATALDGSVTAIDPEGDAVTFTLVGGSAVGGTVTAFNTATGAFTFTPMAGFTGDASFRFTATDGLLTSAEQTITIAVAANSAPTGTVTISGTATEGETLTAANTLADEDGLGTVTYTWFRDGVTTGSTGETYTLTQADVGKPISVVASYTDGAGKAESVPSLATAAVANANDLPTGTVTITGTATEGETLTASNTLADEDGLGTVTYTWFRNGDPTGVTGGTYTLTQADVGATITVVASYTDTQGTAESVSSLATAAVANVNDAPTGTVTISGTPTEGETLTASNTLADEDGLGTVTYTWFRDGVTTGLTGETYTLTQADVGKPISVVASYTDAQGTLESVSSTATAAIANLNSAPTGAVTISGIATEGETLTASNTLVDADGLGTVTYSWFRNGDPTGVTGETYVLDQIDVGAEISVVATYTDLGGTLETVTSAPTNAVANVNDAPTGSATAVLTGTEDVATVITFASLVQGFTDIDGDTLTVTNLATNVGTIALNGNGTATLTTPANYTGAVTLSYDVTDGMVSIPATLGLTIAAVNDPATIGGAIAGDVTEDNPTLQQASGQLTIVDVDGVVQEGFVAATKTGTYGNLVISTTGLWTYTLNNAAAGLATLNAGQTATDQVVVNAIDGTPQTITITITGADETGPAYTITGTEGNDRGTTALRGTPGNDVIGALGGDDEVFGNAGNDAIYAGAGADNVRGDRGLDTIFGGLGNDTINGGSENDVIHGEENDDNIIAGSGNDTVFGGSGADVIVGDSGLDLLNGGTGNDTLTGGSSDDVCAFDDGFGADVLLDYKTSDDIRLNTVSLTELASRLEVRDAGGYVQFLVDDADTITLQSSLYTTSSTRKAYIVTEDNVEVQVRIGRPTLNDNLKGGSTSDYIEGLGGNDSLAGGAANDTVSGGAGNDTMDGGTGDDYLFGGANNDTVIGGAGNDTLVGGSGNDLLNGGTDADVFMFSAGFGLDTITQFKRTEGDKIDLTDLGVSNANYSALVSIAANAANQAVVTIGGDATNTITVDNYASLIKSDFILLA